MQRFRDLNTRAAQSITFADNRGTNVIFDRAAGKQYNFTETSLTFDLLLGAEILEIINPTSANVRYKINLGTLQASLDFGTLPTGVTVTQTGTIYVVYGIDSLAVWDAVKQPTVNIDPEFAGAFTYEASVLYNTDTTTDNEFTWNVGIYLPTAQLTAVSTIDCTPSYTFGGSANLVVLASLGEFVSTFIYRGNFNMLTNARFDWDLNLTLTSAATLNCVGTRYLDFADSINLAIDSDTNTGQFIDFADDKIVVTAKPSGSLTTFDTYSLPGFTNLGSDWSYQFSGQPTGISFSRAEDTNSGLWTVHYVLTYLGSGAIISEKIGPNNYNIYDNTTFTSTLTNIRLTPGVVVREEEDNYPFVVAIKSGTMDVYSAEPNPDYLVSQYSITGLATNVGELISVSNEYIAIARPNYSFNRDVSIYDITDGSLLRTITFTSNLTAIEIQDDVILISSSTETKLYNILTGSVERTISQGTGTNYFSYYPKMNSVTDLYIAVASPTEVSGSSEGVVRIYQRATGDLQATLVNPNIESTDASDQFGASVVIKEDYCIVTAHTEDETNIILDKGTVYQFT